MDERKRTFDAGVNEPSQDQSINEHPKRFRPEDILGSNRDDPNKIITRLVLNKQQFSKLIGKQGQMITHIRSITGINVRGTDLDEDHRLVLIVGNLPQVLKCFDLISGIIHTTTQVQINASQASASQEISILYMLLEHSKAGKAVGTKGTMLQTLKRKSGAISIRIEKEPLDYAGISLRKLSIEGSLLSIRRAHYFLLELYFDISTSLIPSTIFNQRFTSRSEENLIPTSESPLLMSSFIHSLPCATSSGINEQQLNLLASQKHTPSFNIHPMEIMVHHQHQQQSARVSGQTCLNLNNISPSSEYEIATSNYNQIVHTNPSSCNNNNTTSALNQNITLDSSLGNIEIPFNKINMNHTISYLPFPSLINLGVQQETVRQLIEMKAYLSKYFDLELLIRSKVSENNNLQTSSLDSNFTVSKIIAARKLSHPNDLCFAIPISCVGKIIGKKGILLKELENEFPGIRIYIQKEEYNGCRIAVLSYIVAPQQLASSDNNQSIISRYTKKDDNNNLLANEHEEQSPEINSSQDEYTTIAGKQCTTTTTTTITTTKTTNNSNSVLKNTTEIESFLLECKERIMFMIADKQLSGSENLVPLSPKESSASPIKVV